MTRTGERSGRALRRRAAAAVATVVTAAALTLLGGAPAAGARPAATPAGCGKAHGPGVEFLPGQPRAVRMVTPQGYTGNAPVPLVVLLHSSDSNGYRVLQQSGLQATADAHGFVIAVPDGGIARAKDEFSWKVPGVPLTDDDSSYPPAGTPSDDDYLDGLIAALPNSYCVDPARVYMAGFSGGARMASQFGCDHSGRLAAVAVMAGLRAGIADSGTLQPKPDTCNVAVHLSVIAFHGTADTLNPYAGGTSRRWGYSVDVARKRWATIDACTTYQETALPNGVTRLAHGGCESGTDVQVYRIDGGVHRWPNPDLIDANETMWSFFSSHPRA